MLKEVDQIQKDPSCTAKTVLAVTSDEVSDPIECNDSSNHAAAIKARDRYYNHYRLNFATQVERCVREFWVVKREEQRWRQNWEGLVASLKQS